MTRQAEAAWQAAADAIAQAKVAARLIPDTAAARREALLGAERRLLLTLRQWMSDTYTNTALDYDVALYWIDVRNDIVPFNGGAFFYTAGKSRRKGAELGMDWGPLPRFSVSGALTVSRNEYVEYRNDLGNFAGNEVAGLPPVFVNGQVAYRFPGGFNLAATAQHVGHYHADDANLAFVESYTLFGARAEYVTALPVGTIRAFVSGDNLTEEEHVASVFINGIGGQFYEPGLPRNFSAGVTLALR